MGLKKHGPPQLRLHRQNRRVEALKMTRLQDALALFRKLNQFVGLFEARGQRLFNQQVESRIEQDRGHRVMMHGGHSDRCSIHLEICIAPRVKQLVDCGIDRDRIFLCGISRAGRVRLNGCNQRDALPCRFQLAIHAEMVAPKGTGTDDSDAHNRFAGYCAAPLSGSLP